MIGTCGSVTINTLPHNGSRSFTALVNARWNALRDDAR